MRRLLLAAVGLAVVAGAYGIAQAQDHDGPPQGRPPGHGLFEHFDTDHNGVVTRAEFDATRVTDFVRLDANHDGQLSRDEMRAGLREMFHGRGGFGHGRGGMLERADANHDGNITRDEFLAKPLEMFNRLDKNHDGVISADELQQDRADMQQHREQWRQQHGVDQAHGGRPDPDTNHDGMISRAEYDAMGAAMFQRLDTNGDGQVTQAEAEAARPHHGQ